MKQSRVLTLKIEHTLFEFTCCINEFQSLLDDLTMTDIDYIQKSFKKLSDDFQEKQRQWSTPLYRVS